jgi:alpha-tubulin suppressor-like RCC1 family protein
MTGSKRLLFPILCILVFGCDEPSRSFGVASEPPQLVISDGAHQGNLHFFFLPPLVSAPTFSGSFDPSVSPTVEVCRWSVDTCAQLIAAYTMVTGPGSETIRLEEGYYVVNWHTDALSLDPAAEYRILVLAGEIELGFVDVAVVSSGKDLKNVRTNEVVALLDGRTLPIKFRIEEGAIDVGGNDFGFASISTGTIHSCALTTGGTGYCWGRNVEGQLGDGSNNGSNVPVAVAGGLVFATISAGGQTSCGVTRSGDAYCWGGNAWGQLGDGTGTFSNAPVAVTGGLSFASVSAAVTYNCGLTTDGTAYCWGQGWGGAPVPVASGFASLSAGSQHACAVTQIGDASCWGSNDWGQLGDGTHTTSSTPVHIEKGLDRSGGEVLLSGSFASISAGADHTCGVTFDGVVYCWGRNREGQLGVGEFSSSSPIPMEVHVALTVPPVIFASVDVGWNHSCAVAVNGDPYCWGENAWGQLGDESFAYQVVPVRVAGGLSLVSIDAGASHTCGVASEGDAYCWGSNGVPGSGGQLGDSSYASSTAPKQVAHP